MNLVTRLLLVIAGLLACLVGSGMPQDTANLLVATGGAGLCVAGVVASHLGWRRPVSDGFAWLGIGAVLVFLGNPPASIPKVLAVAVGVVALAGGLHVPTTGTPRTHVQSVLATWSAVAGLAVVVAWGPPLLARGDVVVLDPLTSTGMALRLAGTAVALALAAMSLSLWRGRQQLQQQ